LTLLSGLIFLIAAVALAQPPGGLFEPPQPGQVLPAYQQRLLKLTDEQKKQLSELQKDVDTKLENILTAEQKKSLKEPGAGPGGFGPGRAPFGGPGGFPGNLATVRLDDVRIAIEATEEEWKVVGPKLQQVIAARRVVASESRIMDNGAAEPRPARDGQRPAPGGGAEVNVIVQALADFKAVLDDPKHTKAELQEAAAAIGKARDKARDDLRTAQKNLRQLLTDNQATILLGLGYLD
jgi:Spy/CpxP family protein refolding chaperone